MDQAFIDELSRGYGLPEDAPRVVLGSPLREGEVVPEVRVQIPLAMMNRHGLIAGATGTGKTKTLQVLAGQLSLAGVPVFVADIKGDVTGISAPGDAADERLRQRVESLRWDFRPSGHPVELLSLSGKLGAQVRASVHSFGPTLLGKVLDLNETQTAVLALVFKYCDDHKLPLLDLEDLRTTLVFLSSDEGKDEMTPYGGMAKASVGVILRSLVTLEQEGVAGFFGEPEFDVDDLMRLAPDGSGMVTLLELSDVIDKPRLFSTFMLWMLAQLYQTLPEAGDLPKPKLCFFFDEAHLLFDDASEALLDQVELTVRLIRSKGVGVYFVTHSPTDVPPQILAQLSNRVQHAIRAFTPNDADDLRKVAKTFPTTRWYDVEESIKSLGIGEALVTVLSPNGVPTPLAATRLVPPDSLMAAVTPEAFQALLAAGTLRDRYATAIDRESAHEIIGGRLADAEATARDREEQEEREELARQEQRREREERQREEAERKELERAAASMRREEREREREEKRQRAAYERERREADEWMERQQRARDRERQEMIRQGGGLLRTVLGVLVRGGRRR